MDRIYQLIYLLFFVVKIGRFFLFDRIYYLINTENVIPAKFINCMLIISIRGGRFFEIVRVWFTLLLIVGNYLFKFYENLCCRGFASSFRNLNCMKSFKIASLLRSRSNIKEVIRHIIWNIGG